MLAGGLVFAGHIADCTVFVGSAGVIKGTRGYTFGFDGVELELVRQGDSRLMGGSDWV